MNLALPESSEPSEVQRADHYSLHPVTAGGKGQIQVKFTFDGVLRDIVPGDTFTEIDRIHVSGATLFAGEGKPWSEVFAKHEIEVAKTRHATLIVKNLHDTERALRVQVAIEPRAVSAAVQANHATKVPAVTKRISRAAPVQPKGKRRFSHSRLNAAELLQVAPSDGEKAVLLLRGHAHALQRFFEHRVPLHPSHLSSLRAELDRALGHVGTVTVGGNEVAATISYGALEAMIVSIRAKHSVLSNTEREEVITALNQALARDQTLTKRSRKFPLTPGLSRGNSPQIKELP